MFLNNLKYYAVYKPYNMLSQFTDKTGRKTLSSLYDFPKEVYAAGRLDMDSEGLLLLTNDKTVTDYLLNPRNMHEREYYVQVERIPGESDLDKLRSGIVFNDFTSLPAQAKIIEQPPYLPPRKPPVRERKTVPTSWLSICLVEGKNRQVRRMTAAIGFPTLRLIRVRIKNIMLGNLLPGEVRELTEEEITGLRK